ncbi:hypothetical protein [Ruegeria profundi]|uniref:hypothetical protein n=1 Tax=Ruegeria profundi TaxID=1685378 RepID=UPI001CD75710|nr:hypothetical protein [Ruegeria profundi]MCA0927153.1 hypothetical protein [Ruegeria profundi]
MEALIWIALFAMLFAFFTGLMYIGRKVAEKRNDGPLPRKSYWLSIVGLWVAAFIVGFVIYIVFPGYADLDVDFVGLLTLPFMGYLMKRRNIDRGKPDVTTWMFIVPAYWIFIGFSNGLKEPKKQHST